MMKRTSKMLLITLIAMALILALTLCACAEPAKTDTQEESPKTYTIQYSDGAGGTHTITVESGEAYAITELPTKAGYTFKGLYDAKVGGTQYVDETGMALSVFTDKKNLILFAQFAPKEYAVVLDYQGAAVTGVRRLTVAYGTEISDLPTGLTKEHATFAGWYTEPECGGVQIGDEYGALPIISEINGENFDLSTGIVTLYAGFAPETYTVTFFDETGKSEEVKVGYNTPISEVVPDFRKDGMAVLSWSKRQGDTSDLFTGKVTEDLVLYAVEWAPVLSFDAAGGKAVASIVARAGSAITLPTPIKADYIFAGWYTAGGVKSTATEMPAESLKLTAHWNAQLIFDTNGGTAVNAISEAVGTAITLPTTEKADYIFAGWYDSDGDKYESAAMPEYSLRLTAKYYKVQKEKYVLINDTVEQNYSEVPRTDIAHSYLELDLSEIYNLGVRQIKVSAHYLSSIKGGNSVELPQYNYNNWYSQKNASDAFLLWKNTDKITEKGTYFEFSHSSTLTLSSDKIYIMPYGFNNTTGYSWNYVYNYRKNFWVEVEYPDMTTLY